MRVTIDSFAWIEMVRGTPLGIAAAEALGSAEVCFTPAIVLAEVARRCYRDGFRPTVIRRELGAIAEASTIVPIDRELATLTPAAIVELRARSAAAGLSMPGLSDGLVLATARETDSRVLTGDPHFRGLPDTEWLR